MKDKARLVIIGAGIVGCSAAYHLTQMGWKDIVVLDQGPLFETGGSTSHAPGIIFGTNGSHSMARFARYTTHLLLGQTFEGEQAWYPVGSIEVAETEARMRDLWRRYGWNTSYGSEAHILTPQEVQEKVPITNPDVIKGGLYIPTDGVAKAWKCAGALAQKAIETGGATFYGHTRVTDFEMSGGRVRAVLTDQGRVECEQVLLCTNIWGPVLADKVGVRLPMMACSHYYAITDPLPELSARTGWSAYPVMRHQDRSLYFRHWDGAWCTGSYRHAPRIVNPYQVGKDAYWTWHDEDFAEAVKDAANLFPALRERAYVKKVNGMFVFSTDGFPMMGPTHVPGFWVCVGVWVTHSGGAGKSIAEWMTSGTTEWDMHEMDISRFHAHHATQTYVELRSAQNYREVYDIIHPLQQMENPRNVRLAPYHARLQEQQGRFFQSVGWERPQWYENNARLLEDYEDRIPDRAGWEAREWSRIQGAEHLATRERAALFELSSFVKIEVTGPGAAAFLEHLSANRVAREIGKVTYTAMLNPNGGIQCDLTVTRLAEDQFWVLTGGGSGMMDLGWLRRHAPQDGSVHIEDVSSKYTGIGLWGPKAREILERATSDDVSNEGLPYFTAKWIEIGSAPALAVRISYVGELGWEIYTPTEMGLYVWDTLWQGGKPSGLIVGGMGAFDSLRLEKGYRSLGSDIHIETNPYEAGLQWAVRLNKGDFIGREALLKIKERGISRKLCCLTFDAPEAMALGKEPVFANGKPVGFVTSTNYGYSVGKHILYSYLPIEHAEPGTQVEVEYFGVRHKATVQDEPLFDAEMARLKG
ncbi:MAG: FAD-dependent oxidoreductase [Anaerolineales bacterium]